MNDQCSHVMEQDPQVQLLAPTCQAFCCLGRAALVTLLCVLLAQVESALSSPGEGPRNPGAWREVSCSSGPQGVQKMARPAKSDADFDPNTILQTQDRLSQDYEGLWTLAEVTLLVQEMFMEHLLFSRPEP